MPSSAEMVKVISVLEEISSLLEFLERQIKPGYKNLNLQLDIRSGYLIFQYPEDITNKHQELSPWPCLRVKIRLKN